MIGLLAMLALGAPVTGVAQGRQGMDSLRALARDAPDSVLVESVRHRPRDAREAVRELLLGPGVGQDSAGVAARTAAQRLAAAVAVAWGDSSLVRRVRRFQSLSVADRQATVAADSLVRAGGAAMGSAGIEAAMPLWRESLRRFEALDDTSGIAAVLNALGQGFHAARQEDSAEVYLTRGRDLAQRVGDLATLGRLSGNLGNVYWRQGDLDRAGETFEQTKRIFDRIGYDVGLNYYNSVGLVAWSRRDLAGASREFETGLAASRTAGDSEAAALFLGNLAGVTAEQGSLDEAVALQRQALAIYRTHENWPEVAIDLYRLGQIDLRRGDYPGAVTSLSEAAGILRRIGPRQLNEIDVRMELAQARALMGDLGGARAELDRAEAYAGGRGRASGASLTKIALARAAQAAEQHRFAEAEQQYVRALRLAGSEQNMDVRHDAVFGAQIGLANVFSSRGNYRRAKQVLEQVLHMPAVDRHDATAVRLMIAEAALQLGDTTAARRTFAAAIDSLRAMEATVDEAGALGRLGDLEARAGRGLMAESLYQAGLARLGPRPAPGVAWSLHADLGSVLRSRGALAGSAGELRAAIAEIDRVSNTLPLEEQRSSFRADKWAPYVDLALVERARGRTEAAFEASEQLRARQLLDLLARGRVTEGRGLGRLATREQDLRRRIAALSQQSGQDEGAAGMRGGKAAAEETLTRAQDEYAEVLTEMREANPAYTALVKGEVAPARAVMAALAPDEALLEYLVGDSTTIVFVVTQDSVASLDLHLSHAALAGRVDFARSALASPTDTAGGSARPLWRAPLRRLYEQLVGPVESSGLLAGKGRLLIAPHAELHYLPFAALVRRGTPEQYLVERYVLEYVPSASVWLQLRDRPEPSRSSGVLAFAPRPAALPGSQAEVAAIQRAFGARVQTLMGRLATESTFRALAPAQEIVHLATHGVLNKHNPLFSFVQLGAGGGEDGRLEVHEVFGLTLDARLVVLSACETGVGAGAVADVPPGDDWIGLVQGFLYAGAGNVLATLWPVSDVATARLMERFYDRVAAGRPEAEALALAQRAAARDPQTAQPFFWAGFTLVRGR